MEREKKYECFGGPLHGRTVYSRLTTIQAAENPDLNCEIPLSENPKLEGPLYSTYYAHSEVDGIMLHESWDINKLVEELFERRQNYIKPIHGCKFDPLYSLFRIITRPKKFGDPTSGLNVVSVTDIEKQTDFHRSTLARRANELTHMAFEMWRNISPT